jgi:ABC-type nitrate/sulfonate/bicarbonate transport systems, periplasmic components
MKLLSGHIRHWAAAALIGLGASHAALAADNKVTLQLKWVPQAQFAGYYVAAAKGYYKDEGLDVTIKPGGPDVSPVQVIAGGGADVVVDWMPDAWLRAKGRAAGQHRPGVQPFRLAAGVQEVQRRHQPERLQRQDAGRLVRRQ